MKTLSIIVAATAAASYLVITAEEASAQGRGRSSGGSSVGRSFSGGSSIRSSNGGSTRSFSQSGGNSSRSLTQSGGSNASRSFVNRNSGGSSQGNRFSQSNQGGSRFNQGQGTVRSGQLQNQNGNRIGQVQNRGNNQVGQGQNKVGTQVGQVQGQNKGNNQVGQGPNKVGTQVGQVQGQNKGNNQVGQGPNTGNRPQINNGGNVQANNQPRPSILAPNLRSGLGVPVPKGGNIGGNSFAKSASLPIHRAVQGNSVQRARIGLPLNLAPKAAFTKAIVPTQHHVKWRPFVQRHWRSAFFWVAVAGIGYVTVPEWGYDKFRTYVDRDEPDYTGATTWLNECAVRDEGHQVVRVATPQSLVVTQTVASLPDTQYDERLGRFVNRRWNSPYVWISVPRVGNVTVPQTISEDVQKFMGGSPPDMDAALKVMEEAAASDTVVAEAPQVETPSAQ